MDRNTNYVVVGAFVLLVIGMALSFVYWYTDQKDKRTYQRYEIYYDGTVSGLTAGSPVRYLGVDVGKVARLMLDPKNRKRVEVVADIEESAPIDTRTLALLSLQGVTGLLFIDLEEDPKATSNGPLPMGEHYPVIRSAPSDLDVFLRSLPALANHATDLVDHMDQVFSEENVKNFKAMLANARVASDKRAGRWCTRSRISSRICGTPRTRWTPPPPISIASRTMPTSRRASPTSGASATTSRAPPIA